MDKIDRSGTFRGTIIEHAVGLTKKDYPQFVARLHATHRWVDDPDEMAHFELEEPGWVEWGEYNEGLTGYFVLFNDPVDFNDDTALLNYEQVQLATGWDGVSFDALNGSEFEGKEVLFRTAESTFHDDGRVQVEWIDAPDAPPTREMRKLSADDVKALPKIKAGGNKAKPAAAKPKVAKPSAKKADKAEPKAKSKPPSSPPKAKKKSEPEAEENESGLPSETTMEKAWELLASNLGDNADSDLEDAWMSAMQEVCEDTGKDSDEDFDGANWATVRDIVIKDLDLEVSA